MLNAQENAAQIVLRIGVAFAFIYAAVAGFIDPDSWIGYFPDFARSMIPERTLLILWGIFEIILALWIVSGKKIFIPNVVASLSLAGLIIGNLDAMDIIFRD